MESNHYHTIRATDIRVSAFKNPTGKPLYNISEQEESKEPARDLTTFSQLIDTGHKPTFARNSSSS